jgi:hypothetical protein
MSGTVWWTYVCRVDICQVLSGGHMYVGCTYVRYCLVDIWQVLFGRHMYVG